MIKCERFHLPAASLPADNNIRYQYPIHHGKWVRHPDVSADEASLCRFELSFELDAPCTIELHASADSRFELWCDEAYMGMGPDRSDIEHWSFHSYRVQLEKGTHRLRADVHFLGHHPAGRPWAQTCIEPGFVLFCENASVDLNTGSAAWRVTRIGGVSTRTSGVLGFFVVGPDYTIDAGQFFSPPPAVDAQVMRTAGYHNQTGTIQPGWKLFPTRLPEQMRRPVGGGRVRCVTDIGDDDPFPEVEAAVDPAWQGLIDGRAPVTVPAHRRVVVLWDLEEYHTAYTELTAVGGKGASVRIEWAESCIVNSPQIKDHRSPRVKDHRDQIAGKYFVGNGDTFVLDGPRRTMTSLWWRAGRYIRVVIETGDQPATIERVRLLESRMPLENHSVFAGSDADIAPIISLAVRGIQMCAHETYMDCPYYEQMMYVGDTRLQMLTAYVINAEDRLNQRALELFDWSRQENGFVLERYPSQPRQLSCTFSMIWAMMLRDHAWWRDDAAFVRQRLKGMRCLLEEFKALPDEHAPLLPALPGWSFMDWVDGMSFVNHPGPDQGVSAVVNLLLLNALDAAAELEQAFGDEHLARYNRAWAKRLAAAIDQRFWNPQRGMFADDTDHQSYSEHAQCLALLTEHFPAYRDRCFESLVSEQDLIRTTVYFSFYLLETFAKFGRGDLIQDKLEFWKQMVAMGLRTPVETPEPTRSDCHAWSSHPLFHLHASLAGVRPASPGFGSVRIVPSPGSLTELASTIPHPAGVVSLAMKRQERQWQVDITLPTGVEGALEWRGQAHAIKGTSSLRLPV